MDVSAKLQLKESLKFSVRLDDGRSMELNSADAMGSAFTPMELFLVALAGCTAMDVQWIMTRQRQSIDGFEVGAKGKRRTEDPKYYEQIDLEYVFYGKNLKRQAVERAIRLSQEKYCSVRAMLNDSVKLRTTYSLVESGLSKKSFTYSVDS